MTDLRELLGDKHDDVIEKAARATWFGYLTYPDPCPEWDGLTEARRRIHRSVVSSTLASVLPDLLDAAAERDALAEWRDFSEAELEALRATLEGRCLSDITHRDEEHRQSVCILPADHRTAHDDAMGTTWTDANHWQPDPLEAERDALAAAVERVRALHVAARFSGATRWVCSECCIDWTCPTIRALDESEADHE